MQTSLAEKVIEEIEANKKLKTRLAELIVSEPEVRLFMLNSILPDVAKKEDIKELRNEIAQLRGEMAQLRGEISQVRGEIAQLRGEINQEIAQLRGEIAQLRREMYSNFKWTVGIILTIWGATVIPILLRLIKAI
ncbi:MAG: hypothetical protein LM590_06490 [Thermofilum sp.]|nr:hypothetical protein [Thermofilum sp.]